MGYELRPPTAARGRLAISLSPAAIARLRGVRAAQPESRLMSLSCVLGLDSNRRLTSEPVPEMRAGRRALAAVPDWRPRATRLEIELVAIGAGPNGGRHRDSEDQNRNREQTATAESWITSSPHRCVPCAWRAAGGPHDCSYGPSPPQAPESSPGSSSEIPGQQLPASTSEIRHQAYFPQTSLMDPRVDATGLAG